MEILQAVLIFIAIVLLLEALFLLGRRWLWNPEKKRIKRQLRQIEIEQYGRQKLDLTRHRVMSDIPWFNRLLSGAGLPIISHLERMVMQADLPRPLGFYMLVSVLLFFATLLVLSFVLPWFFVRMAISFLVALLPILYISLKKKGRIDRFEQQFPEVMDMLARSLKAGHAFTGGLQMIGQEFEDPAGTEFRKTLDEINFGVPYEDALKNMLTRIESEDLKLFVISVIIQRESGGNLAEILENIGRLIRERFVLKGQIKILSAESRLSAVILASLPFLMALYIYFVNREYLGLLFSDPIGHVMLITGGIMLILGIIILKRMTILKV